MFRKSFTLFLWGTVALFVLISCSKKPADNFPEGVIKVGIITSLTGSKASFGEAQKNGYELAVEEINASGGVAGHPLALVYRDDASTPEQAIIAAEDLIKQQDISLLIGSYSSSATFPMAGIVEGFETPLIVPSAATDTLMQQDYKWVFRINAPSSQYSQTVFDFLADMTDVKKIAILFESTDFGTSTARSAKEFAEAHGFEVVSYEAYDAKSGDLGPLLTKVQATQPEAVFAISYLEDALLMMQQSRELDFSPKIFAGAAGFASGSFITKGGKNAEYVVTVSQWTPDVKWAGVQSFVSSYQEHYGALPGYHAAETYTALKLAADAIERAGSLDKEKIRIALRETNLEQTIFGPIQFDERGQNNHPMVMMQVQNDQFVTVYPKEYKSADLVFPVAAWGNR